MIYRFRDMIYPAGMISADADDIRLRRMLGNLPIASPTQYIMEPGLADASPGSPQMSNLTTPSSESGASGAFCTPSGSPFCRATAAGETP